MSNDSENPSSNPQPPALTAEEKEILEGDKIGETAYSKKWVLSILVRMAEVTRCGPAVKNEHDPQESDGENEVDPVSEEELCELWDMTMDSDVSNYLISQEGISVIEEVLIHEESPRKQEIYLGILANMACTSNVCKEILKHPTIIDIALWYIKSPDTRSLIELSRLISVFISNKECREEFIERLRSKLVVEEMISLLDNSLNVELLDIGTKVIDQLLFNDGRILEELSSKKIVTLICDIYRRVAVKHPQTVGQLLHILQLISTTEKGVSSLVSVEDSSLIAKIILKEGSKNISPSESSFQSLASSCCVLNVVMCADEKKTKQFSDEELEILLTVLTFAEELCAHLSCYEGNLDKESREKDVDYDDYDALDMYLDYLDAVVDFLVVLSEMFLSAKISKEMQKSLEERRNELQSILTILDDIPKHSSNAKKIKLLFKIKGTDEDCTENATDKSKEIKQR
ncbi:protein SAAL1-like [Rhopilema esculentum]|uniref:protein SAAL1-like n=1 Tax=Rhopilema esculentum TaxID=499914 RepID=UPI0031CE2A14|eukprot:gene11226-21412_t